MRASNGPRGSARLRVVAGRGGGDADPPDGPGHRALARSVSGHLVLHDIQTGKRHAPIQHLPDAKSPFELHNSPLSEYACLGFEYGYAVEAQNALVLWEAQSAISPTAPK